MMSRAAALALLLCGEQAAGSIRVFEPQDWDTVDYSRALPRGHLPVDEELQAARRDAAAEAFAFASRHNRSLPNGERQMHPEFGAMKSVLVAYPLGLPASLVAEFSHDLPTVVLCAKSQQSRASSTFRNAGANMDNIMFVNVKTDSYWTRDFGPWWVHSEQGDLAIVDFTYNRGRPNDNKVNSRLATLWDVPYEFSGLVHTGGDMMVDGMHTAASTYLVYEDNNCGSRPCQSVDNKMKASYGITQYQTVADPTGNYIEHIDCWGKFVAEDKIIIDQVGSSSRHYKAYEAVAEYYAQSTNSKGQKWQVFRTKLTDGAAQAYSNSLVLNNKAYVPVTGSGYSSQDQAALQVYQDALPDHEIVGVTADRRSPWDNTDALHCRTHGMPIVPPQATVV